MECEKAYMSVDTRETQASNDKWHQEKTRNTSQPAEATEKKEVIHHSGADESISLIWFIQENTILAGLNTTGKAIMMTWNMTALIIENQSN